MKPMFLSLLLALPIFGNDARLVTAAGGATITLEGGAAATVRVTLRFDPDKPANARITLRALDTAQSATASIDAARVGALRTLAVPPGWYELSATMPHHRAASRTFHAIAGNLALGEIALPAAPVISGLVRRRGGEPLPGARVTFGEGDRTTTSAAGRFAIEVTGKWPADLLVRAPGLGTKIVPLAAAEANVELQPIELAPAAGVRVAIQRNTFDGPLEVSIGVREEGAPPRWIGHQRIDRGSSVAFGDLDAGSYTLLVAGPQPLERVARAVNVGAGDRAGVTIPIHFVLAHGLLTMGGKPMAGVSVRFENAGSRWESTVTTSAGGEIITPLWQTGAYGLSIRGAGAQAPIVRNINLDDRAFADFRIDVPDRRVRGRVVDEEGAPVSNALVSLRSQTETFAATVRTRTGEDGTFEFNGVQAGGQTLRVMPEGFLRPDPRKFALGENDHGHEETMTLDRGSEREVRVVAHDGTPVARAAVVIASADRVRAAAVTNERGRARVSAPSDAQSVVYVFPKEGSLVMRRLGREEASVRVDVPLPTASIEIAALTTDGAAVPNVDLLMRYNGEILPPDVLRELERQQGMSLETDQSGSARLQHLPSGTYEFWPYRSDAEAEALLASASALAAPIVVNAVSGENKVTVRFRKK
jgi:hypothetical protein